MRVLGVALLAAVVAAWLAVVEVFWLPLRIGGVPVPLSIGVAVLGNVVLVPLTARLSSARLAALVPAAVWLLVTVAAGQRRPEGDVVLTGGGLSVTFLLVGAASAALAVGRVLAAPPRPAGDVLDLGAGQGQDGARR